MKSKLNAIKVVSSLPSFDTLGEDDDEASKQTIVAEQFQRSVGSFHNLVNLSKRRQELLFLEVCIRVACVKCVTGSGHRESGQAAKPFHVTSEPRCFSHG